MALDWLISDGVVLVFAFIFWLVANLICIFFVKQRSWEQPVQIGQKKIIQASKITIMKSVIYASPLMALGIFGVVEAENPATATAALLLVVVALAFIFETWRIRGLAFSVAWNDQLVEGTSGFIGRFIGFKLPPRRELRIEQLRSLEHHGGVFRLWGETHDFIEFTFAWEGHNHLLLHIVDRRPDLFEPYREKLWFKRLLVASMHD